MILFGVVRIEFQITDALSVHRRSLRDALQDIELLVLYFHEVSIERGVVGGKRQQIDAENAIRPFVIGRKNWLFANTPKGAHASACFYSLVETAKANGVEPYAYLNSPFKNDYLLRARWIWLYFHPDFVK